MRFEPAMYGFEPQEFSRLQDGLLRETVSWAAQHSPFYRTRLSETDVSGTRTVADLSSIPLTNRTDLQSNNQEFWAVAAPDIAELVVTTGTTGEPITVAMTAHDLGRLAEGERRGFSWLGAKPGHRFHIAITLDNLFIAGLAYHLGLQQMGVSAIRVGAQSLRRHLDVLKRFRPDGIVAVPSLLVALARRAEEDGDDLAAFAPKRAMLIGDAIRDRDLHSNALGRLLESHWGDQVYSTYGLTEAGLAFHECPMRQGLHSHPDLILVEIVDDGGTPVPDGEIGEVVITTLQTEGMPLLRYQTGDMSFRVPGECPCGRRGARIGPILGRRQHRLKVKGTTLYPKSIEDALVSAHGVVNFLIEAHTGADGTDRLTVRIGTKSTDPLFTQYIGEHLCAKARVTPEIHLEQPATIERLMFEAGHRKPRTFIDRRTGRTDVRVP
jgi:phenylacetate-CoA ligase